MSLTGYYTPDISASMIDYRVTNDPYTLYKTDQVLEFTTPIYEHTLKISLASYPDVKLVKGVDWEVYELDTTAVSRMKNMGSFDYSLLKSIIFRKIIVDPVKINLYYQRLYPISHKQILNNPDYYIELNPDLVYDIIDRLNILQSSIATLDNTVSISYDQPRIIKEDYTGKKVENKITGERHIVNTYDKSYIIRPVQGSFYQTNLVLRVPERNKTLEVNKDYIVFGFNQGKTKTVNEPDVGSIYEYIMLIYPYAGTVEIEYQAYGGSATLSDVTHLNNAIVNLYTYLQKNTFVTESNLKRLSVITNMQEKIDSLEARMRALLTAGRPTYGDVTNGTVFVQAIYAQNVNYHWWTVASLYKVDGCDDIITADRMKLRLKLANAGYQADLSVSVNLDQPFTPVTIETSSVVQDIGYCIFGTENKITPILTPKVRIIYNKSTDMSSGALLQFGFNLPGLSDILAVEDSSGISSCWRLVPTVATPIPPSDTAITLPSGALWESSSSESVSHEFMFPSSSPYRIWEGAIKVEDLIADQSVEITSLLPSSFIYKDFDNILLVFHSDEDEVITVSAPLLKTMNQGYMSSYFVKLGSADLITFHVKIGIDNQVSIETTIPSSNIPVSRYSLKYILIEVK